MLKTIVCTCLLALSLVLPARAQTPPDGEAGAGPQDAPFTQAEFREVMSLLFALLNGGGRFPEAEAQGRALYGLVARDFGPDSREVLELEMLITAAVMRQGRYDEALGMAETVMQRAVARLDGADTLAYEIAGLYIQGLTQSGLFPEAAAFGAQVILEAEEHLPRDHPQITRLRLAVAQATVKAGLYDEALAHLGAVVAATEGEIAPDMVPVRAAALGERGLLAQDLRGGPAGAEDLAAAEALLRDLYAPLKDGDVHPEVVTLTVALARAEHFGAFGGTAASAEARLTPLLARVAAVWGEDHLLWARVALQWALVHGDTFEDRARAEAAVAVMGRAVAVRGDRLSPLDSDLIEARDLYAGVLAYLGRADEALAVYQSTIDAGWQPSRDFYIYALARAQTDGKLPKAEIVPMALRFLQATQQGPAARAQDLLTARLQAGPDAGVLRARSDAVRALTAARAALVEATARPASARDGAAEAALRAEVAARTEALTAAEVSLREAAPALAAATGAAPMTLEEIQAALGPDEALVVLDISAGPEGQNFGLVVTAAEADWYAVDAETAGIAADVADLRAAVQGRLGVRTAEPLAPVAAPGAFPVATAETLYATLLARAEPLLAGKAHVYFDLRGPIAALPPQMLLTGPADAADLAAAPWLVRRHAVTVLPAINALRAAALAREARAPRAVLAFADPVYDGAAAPAVLRSALAPLPETADEARAVAVALGAPPAAAVTGPAASEAAVKAAALADYRVLYFATHGLVAGDVAGGDGAPLPEPALALTAGQGEDGFLTASEVAMLRLNADWVVLSACNTAVGADPDAEALSGLAQAFLYAGARALMVSHWPVESKSAVALMTDIFARRAADPGLRAAEAQRAAVLALMQREGWDHPAYWAPFVLVGSPD